MERTGECGGQFLQILRSKLLGRDVVQEGHVEIFLPAHQGVVCAPENQVSAAVAEEEGHGGELGIFLRNKNIPIEGQADVSEPFCCGGCCKQLQILVHPDLVGGIGVGQYRNGGVFQRNLRVRCVRHGGAKINIDEGGQNQAVHGIGPHGGEGDVAPPGKIVKYIGHRSHLRYLVSISYHVSYRVSNERNVKTAGGRSGDTLDQFMEKC